MATIKIHCPNCHQEYDVDEADLGLEAECQSCKQSFVVQRDAPSQETQPSKSKKTVTVEKKTTLRQMKCDMCGGTDLVKQEGLFVCQHCGAKYSVEEARKMMMEGDGDLVVSGTIKIDNNAKLENLYTLARREYRLENYEEARKYYEAIIVDDPNNWEPIFAISFIKAGRGNHEWENVSTEIESFIKRLDESVHLLMEDEKEENKNVTLKNVIVKTVSNMANSLKEVIDKTQEELKLNGKWTETNRQIYINNINSISLLLDKAGDICHQYLPEERSKALQYWKMACAYALSEVIHNQIAVKIMNEEPGYVPPPVKQVRKGCSVFMCLLLIVFVVFGVLFTIAFLDR